MLSTSIFSQLRAAALARLQTLVADATWSYVQPIVAGAVDSQTVILTPGLSPFGMELQSRGGAWEIEAQLAVTVLDRITPGQNLDTYGELLLQIAALFERESCAGCVCTNISFPLFADADLAASNIYQGVVQLTFRAAG